jgi:hypothetical protein
VRLGGKQLVRQLMSAIEIATLKRSYSLVELSSHVTK